MNSFTAFGATSAQSIRATDDVPRRVSVIDVVQIVTSSARAKSIWREMCLRHPEVSKDVTQFKFPGQGQRETPVATEDTAKRIARKVLCVARMSLGEKKAKLAAIGMDTGDVQLEMKQVVEADLVQDLSRAFAAFAPIRQFQIGPYRIDLYLSGPKIAIECDEYGHARYSKLCEVQRQAFVEAQLGCTFVRFDPYASDFSLMDPIAAVVRCLTGNTENTDSR